MSTLILPPGLKPTADQLTTVHPWDRPGFDPATLDAEDTRAYWARRQSAIVTATSVSEEVFETAKAAERIRNNRNFARIRVGMAPALPLPKDGEAIAPAGQAGLQLLDEPGDGRLLVLDEVGTIDPALFDQLRRIPLDPIGVEEITAAIAGHGDTFLQVDTDGAVTRIDPSEILLRDEPQPSLDEILAIAPEEGEESDRDLLVGLRRAGADVKIKGKSPAPAVHRRPVFNPIEVLRQQHRLHDATRMNALSHAVKIGIVCLKTAMDPPGSLPAGFSGVRA